MCSTTESTQMHVLLNQVAEGGQFEWQEVRQSGLSFVSA